MHQLHTLIPGFFRLGNPPMPFVGPEPDIDLASFAGRLSYFFTDITLISLLACGLLLVSTFYIFIIKRGRFIPTESPVLVRKPPFSLSPAAIRYIYTMGFDTKCLVSAIVNATLKGCYTIRWGKIGFQAERTPEPDFESLTNDEKSALTFRKDHYWDKITVAHTFSLQTRKMSRRLNEYLQKRYSKLFKQKRGWIAGGIGLSSFFMFLIFGLAAGHNTLTYFVGFYLMMWATVIIPAYFLMISWEDKYIFGLIISGLYLSVGVLGIFFIEFYTYTPFFTPVVLPFAGLNLLFLRQVPSYTKYGAHVMGQILAFRTFVEEEIQVAKKDGFTQQGTYLLPYAMALDLDLSFTPYFEGILAKQTYGPYAIFDKIYKK